MPHARTAAACSSQLPCHISSAAAAAAAATPQGVLMESLVVQRTKRCAGLGQGQVVKRGATLAAPVLSKQLTRHQQQRQHQWRAALLPGKGRTSNDGGLVPGCCNFLLSCPQFWITLFCLNQLLSQLSCTQVVSLHQLSCSTTIGVPLGTIPATTHQYCIAPALETAVLSSPAAYSGSASACSRLVSAPIQPPNQWRNRRRRVVLRPKGESSMSSEALATPCLAPCRHTGRPRRGVAA